MRKLLFGIPLLGLFFIMGGSDSPHGKDFKLSCDACHNTQDWKVDKARLSFNHNTTSFALSGQHQAIDCRACHSTLVFSEAKSECSACHADIHEQTVGTDCARCHNTGSWLVSNITAIHRMSRFPLVGAHAMADCGQCHKSQSLSRFDPMGIECINCHRTNFNSTTNPNHLTAGFSTECTECHRVNAYEWGANGFNHDFFPLTLGHSGLTCSSCHKSGAFASLSTNCYNCHQANYNGTTNPNHIQAGFSNNCAECHTTNPGWAPATLDHGFFPLTLGHSINNCSQCHVSGNYTNNSPVCRDCHQANYNSAADPNHLQAGFPTDCILCHTTTPGWAPATFDHSFFPLTLGHNLNSCSQCHLSGNYTNTSPICRDCHLANFNSSADPNHQAAGFSTDCIQCHTTNPGWTPATFDHGFFPLTLGHNLNSCAQCHTSGNYANTSPICKDCHMASYNGTNNPNHVQAGFPTDCIICHTTNPGWTPSTFNHSFFPLTLGHSLTGCTQCHTSGNYANTSPICKDCHMADYNSATNPNHIAANFPTDCILCHTTNPGWAPATFDHDGLYFPIYSGHHNGEWNSCSDCHTNPSNYAVFSCINSCHSQSSTNGDHNGVPNYQYNSNACYACHPDGSEK